MIRRRMIRSMFVVHVIFSFISVSTPVSLLFLNLSFCLQAATSQDRRPWCLTSYFWTSTTPETGSRWPIRWCRSPAPGSLSLETLCATTTTAASSTGHFLIPGVWCRVNLWMVNLLLFKSLLFLIQPVDGSITLCTDDAWRDESKLKNNYWKCPVSVA